MMMNMTHQLASDIPDGRHMELRRQLTLIRFVASDIPALLKYTQEVYLIENNETLVLTKDNITIFNAEGKEVNREVFHVS